MRLSRLVSAFAPGSTFGDDIEVRALALDSRKVSPGALFFAIPGTTLDALAIHEALAATRGAGGRALVMECSSHALDQERTAGVRFKAAVFTNFSRDHLDYHETPRAYFEAKARLFRTLDSDAFAVLNDRDPMSKELAL